MSDFVEHPEGKTINPDMQNEGATPSKLVCRICSVVVDDFCTAPAHRRIQKYPGGCLRALTCPVSASAVTLRQDLAKVL
jgi:hypothetical protein